MSKRLIKRYKYIDSGTVEIVGPRKVLKDAEYTSANYAQFYEDDPEYKAQQEKQSQADIDVAGDTPKTDIKAEQPLEATGEPEPEVQKQTAQADTDAVSLEAHRKAIEAELTSQFETQLAAEKQASRNEGFQEGKQAGQAQNAAEIQNLKTLITNIQTEFQSAAGKFFDEVEKLTMDMSVLLAKKIVGEAVAVVPDIIRTNVDKCVKLLAGAGTAQIKINPNDYETIKNYIPELEQQTGDKFTFVLEPDNKIERGGCVVEFEGSSIDGRIQTQIEKIQKQMEMIT